MDDKRNMSLFKKLHYLSLMIGVLTIALPIVFWSRIPEQIPKHYNAAGIVDNWGDKTSIVLLFFVIALLMGMMSIAVYCVKTGLQSKYSSDCEQSEMHVVYPMLIVMNLVLQLTFSYIMFCTVSSRPLGVFFLPIVIIGTFAPIAYMIYKCTKIKGTGNSDMVILKRLEEQESGVLYRSAVDWWLGLLLFGSVAMVAYYAIEPIVKTGEIDWMMMLIFLGTSVIILPLANIKYVMYKEHMLISMNIYGKVRIRYQDIVGIKKTLNPLSSAALSLKRLQIDYVENGVHRMILISPKRRKEFLDQLEEKREKTIIKE